MGEKRFVSTIARRLDTLGALTRGQRQTGSQGLFRAEDSLESPVARAALNSFYRRILRGEATSVTYEHFCDLTGLTLLAEDGTLLEELPPMARFLNRLLALEIDCQNAIFAEFSGLIEAHMQAAREAGTLDCGMETIRAARLVVLGRQMLREDEGCGALTELVTLERCDPVSVLSFPEAEARHKAALGRYIHRETGEPVYMHRAASEYSDEGEMIRRVQLYGVEESHYLYQALFTDDLWEEVGVSAFGAAWGKAAADAPRERVTQFHMVTGLLLPVWKHLPESASPRIWRAVTDDGSALLGLVLSPAEAAALKAVLCPTDVTDPATLLTALVDEGRRVSLAGGAALALRRVGAGLRLEIEGVSADDLPALKAAGCFTEIITWRTRVFVPFDPVAPQASVPRLTAVLSILPLEGGNDVATAA